jgi:hypothetical protein
MIKTGWWVLLLSVALSAESCSKNNQVREEAPTADTYLEAYVYGFPMILVYQAMYQFNVDETSPQYKAPFNQIWSESQVFTPNDTAIATPNLDTPYSLAEVDLRAEPIVFCVPNVEKGRYYSVQLTDMYSFNYGYAGSRSTGNGSGCYMIAGPGWNGENPAGIKKTFRSETRFGLVTFRTQLFNRADIGEVEKIQAGYSVRGLSAFLHQAAPPQPATPDFPVFTKDALGLDFPKYLNFLLQFCPPVSEETALRAQFAAVGIEAGKPFDLGQLSEAQKTELERGVKQGYEAIARQRGNIGEEVNGWTVGAAFGDRIFYHGRYLLRAAAALAGIYGNSAQEAIYMWARKGGDRNPLDGSKHSYTLTFAAGQFPPVNGFWSLTLYDGSSQLVVANPIDRYLINSRMLPAIRKNKDGSLTMYIQRDPPSADKRSNWLPAPNGPFYTVMRLYWLRESAPSILPVGSGTWNPPAVEVAQ